MTEQGIERHEPFWKAGYAAVTIAGVVLVAAAVRWTQRDVRAAQQILAGLAAGRPSVSQAIRWEHLRTLDADIGSAYAGLPNDHERQAYQQSFVAKFAEGFRQAGGYVKAFRGWRVQSRNAEQVVVAADYPLRGKTLLLSLSASGRRQLEGLQWQ